MLKFTKPNPVAQPTTWQVSADGKKMIGHLVLKRTNCNCNTSGALPNSSSNSTIDSSCDFNSSQSLGLKIVGGRPNPLTNQTSAYVVKVKKDSISDTVGRLKAGDEVVKWNGKTLRGLSYDEVFSLMNKSKHDNEVELDVERIIEEPELAVAESSLNDSRSTTNEVSSNFSSPRSQDSLMITPVNMRSNLDNSLVLMTDLSKTYMNFFDDYDMNNSNPALNVDGRKLKAESEKLSDSEESPEARAPERSEPTSPPDLLDKSKCFSKPIHNNLSFESSSEEEEALDDMDKMGENEPEPVDIRTFLQPGYRWRVAVKALSFIKFLKKKNLKFDLPEYLVCKQIASHTVARLDVSNSLTPLTFIDEESLHEDQQASYMILNDMTNTSASQFDQSAFAGFVTPSVNRGKVEENAAPTVSSSVCFDLNNSAAVSEVERVRHANDLSINAADTSLPRITPLSTKSSHGSLVNSPEGSAIRRRARVNRASVSPYSLNKSFYRHSDNYELMDQSARSSRLNRIINGTQSNLYTIDLKTPTSPLSFKLRPTSISSNSLQPQVLDTQFTPLLFSSFNQQQQASVSNKFKPNNLTFLITNHCSPTSPSPDHWSIKSSGRGGADRSKRRRKTQELGKTSSDSILHKSAAEAHGLLNTPPNTPQGATGETAPSPTCIEHLVFTLKNFALTACVFVSPKPKAEATTTAK